MNRATKHHSSSTVSIFKSTYYVYLVVQKDPATSDLAVGIGEAVVQYDSDIEDAAEAD